MTLAEKRFEKAFIDCLRDGVHPGPTQINKRLGRTFKLRSNLLNGRESRQRRFLMYDFAIPLMRSNNIRDAGQVPRRPQLRTPFFVNHSWPYDGIKEKPPVAGWRRKFYPDIDFDVKLKLR